MAKFKRYETALYCEECGTDDGMDFNTIREAEAYIKRCIKGKEEGMEGVWEAGAIYDTKTKTCVRSYNAFPAWFYNEEVDKRTENENRYKFVMC